MAKAIDLFTKYQLAKLTKEKIDMQEFMYLEQQKKADFVNERTLPKNIKIDIESILESFATEQETISSIMKSFLGREILFCVSSGWERLLHVLQLIYISQE